MKLFSETISDPNNTCEVYVDGDGTHVAIRTDPYEAEAWMPLALAKKLGAVLEKAIAAAEAHKGERL